MTREEREQAIAILENEKKCVNRANKNDYCNRDCYNCELVKTDTEILTALDMAIKTLEQEPKTGHWKEPSNPYDIDGTYYCYCDNCYGDAHEKTDFCPNCGARMVEQERSE